MAFSTGRILRTGVLTFLCLLTGTLSQPVSAQAPGYKFVTGPIDKEAAEKKKTISCRSAMTCSQQVLSREQTLKGSITVYCSHPQRQASGSIPSCLFSITPAVSERTTAPSWMYSSNFGRNRIYGTATRLILWPYSSRSARRIIRH